MQDIQLKNKFVEFQENKIQVKMSGWFAILFELFASWTFNVHLNNMFFIGF